MGEEMEGFRVLLEAFEGWGDGHDVVVCDANYEESFSVASCYDGYARLRNTFGPSFRFDEAKGLVWKAGVPFKIKALSEGAYF